MSKLYKELNYDTDRVMQPGDPITSPDGQVSVSANNDGTASVSSPAVESYDVTFTIPDVSGVTITARVSDLSNEYPTYTVLSAIGIENPTFSGSTINSNDEYWGEIAVRMPADQVGVTDTTKIWPNGCVVNLFLRSTSQTTAWTTVSSYTTNYGSGSVSKTLVTSESIDKKMDKVQYPTLGKIATISSDGNLFNGVYTEDELVTNARKPYYGYCETTGNNSAKTVNTTPTFGSMYTGLVVYIKFRYANITQNPTLNVNGKGAHNIYRYGTTSDFTTTSTGYQTLSWKPNEVVGFVYDGSAWMMLKPAEASVNNQGVVKLSDTYSSQISDAQHAAPTQKALYDAYTALNTSKANSSDLGDAASKNVGTASGTVAAGDHTHSDYVSKSATTDQAMSSSLTFPAGKTVEVGSFASASTYVASMYASSTESYMACGTGEQYTWIDKDGIKHTTDGENTVSTLLFPAANSTSKTIATTDQLPDMTTVATKSAVNTAISTINTNFTNISNFLASGYKETTCDIGSRASGWTFSTDGSNWNNKFRFFHWGQIGFIFGCAKCSSAITADTTKNNIGVFAVPSGYSFMAGHTGARSCNYIGIIGSNGAMSVRFLNDVSANSTVNLGFFVALGTIGDKWNRTNVATI